MQQRQTSAPAADKDEFCGMVFDFIADHVMDFHFPQAFTRAFDVLDGVLLIYFNVLGLQVINQHVSQSAEIDVCSRVDLGCGNRFS